MQLLFKLQQHNVHKVVHGLTIVAILNCIIYFSVVIVIRSKRLDKHVETNTLPGV